MFTGLVEERGKVVGRSHLGAGPGARLTVQTTLGPLALGESVAVDGVCLTVVDGTGGGPGAGNRGTFVADVSAETLARTTLGTLAVGSQVNLERATALGQRMGGHVVAGHVDGLGTVAERTPVGEALKVAFAFPPALAGFLAEKGSVTVNGVSLTINGVTRNTFDVVLVPHTRKVTELDALPTGATVNLEVDILARYVARQLQVLREGSTPGGGDAAWLATLTRAGYVP